MPICTTGKYILVFEATNFGEWFVTQKKLTDTAVLELSLRTNPSVLGGLPYHFQDLRSFFLEKISDVRSTSILANHEKMHLTNKRWGFYRETM